MHLSTMYGLQLSQFWLSSEYSDFYDPLSVVTATLAIARVCGEADFAHFQSSWCLNTTMDSTLRLLEKTNQIKSKLVKNMDEGTYENFLSDFQL